MRAALRPEFELGDEIGRGGMSVVYEAVEMALGRRVALKLLPPGLATDQEVTARFAREARLTAAIAHPNVMPVLRVGVAAGVPFLAMPLVEGRTLDAIVAAHGPLSLGAAVAALRAVADALAAAHGAGVVHRDVKGGNVLVGRDGRVLVTDFGIARALEEGAVAAGSTVIGTPCFMSPEQLAGRPVGAAADQYSLGVLAFHLLTGTVPFDAKDFVTVMHHHLFTPAPSLGAVRADAPAALSTLVARLLAKAPYDRFARMTDVVAALDAVPLDPGRRELGAAELGPLADGGAVARLASGVVGTPPTLPSVPTVPGLITRAAWEDMLARWGNRPVPRRLGRLARFPGLPRARWALPGRAGARRAAVGLAAAALVLLTATGATAVAAMRRSPESLAREGATLYARGERAAARRAFALAAEERPGLVAAHVYLGRIAREEGRRVAARRELRTAIELAPGNAPALREMGALLLSEGRYELAARFYRRALAADPGDRAARGYLGCALVRQGALAEGWEEMGRAGAGPWGACGGQ
ncbi:MAG TPA: serine/threonine-protein kinase [Gemmatimonadaceae bacterium]|nr:serine/threonine-protein kinase [Gemmatimonadaceae bacterium]